MATNITTNTSVITEQTGISGVRPGTHSDAIPGVVPLVVAAPSSVEEVSRLLAWANERGLKVVPCGSHTKQDRGNPPERCDILLDLGGLNKVVEHAAGDMTVTVQACAKLRDLQAELAKAGQFLAIDPPMPGTVGGLIATADSGSWRLRYGGVRDLILGVTFVRADGVVARGGGKVVKNVAGYDLPKLLTGSLGTLGVIVEATFRLYPVPVASATVVAANVTATRAGQLAQAILDSTLVPTALDYLVGPGQQPSLAIRFQGSARSTEAQAGGAMALLANGATDSSYLLTEAREATAWQSTSYLVGARGNDLLAHVAAVPTDLPGLLESALADAGRRGAQLAFQAHLGHGHALLRWHEPPTETALEMLSKIRQEAENRGGNLVIWRAPAEVRARIDAWGDAGEGLDLMRSIKLQFDPNNTLNPGRFAGGI